MKKAAFQPPFANLCCIFAGRVFRASLEARKCQEPAPLSVVTARRFCDQQEMSSHTATGRSLP